MKVMGVFAGAYHSFVQNSKGEIYAFGLNMRGQLGINNYENRKKPILVYSLLPGGYKNPRSNFFIETAEYRRKSKKSRDENAEFNNITNIFEKYDLQEEEKSPTFLLGSEEVVTKIACGPLHTAAITNKNRMFTCGFGDKYCLGNGKTATTNEFTEIKLKTNSKIEKVEAGVTSLGYVAGGRAYICGTFGEKVYEMFATVPISEEIVDLKLGEKSAIFLTKKGDVYQWGDWEAHDKITDHPKRVEKLSGIKQLFSGSNSFFAISEHRHFYGWGENEFNQVTGVKGEKLLAQPKQISIPINFNESVSVVSGNGTTFLLSSKPLETEYQKYLEKDEESKSQAPEKLHKRGGSSSKSALSNLCGTEEQHMLNELGVQPRIFNCSMEIDFNDLIFESQISEGGYGIIYKGLWRDTVVAIKMFKIEN